VPFDGCVVGKVTKLQTKEEIKEEIKEERRGVDGDAAAALFRSSCPFLSFTSRIELGGEKGVKKKKRIRKNFLFFLFMSRFRRKGELLGSKVEKFLLFFLSYINQSAKMIIVILILIFVFLSFVCLFCDTRVTGLLAADE
jgi:hypothetical protein